MTTRLTASQRADLTQFLQTARPAMKLGEWTPWLKGLGLRTSGREKDATAKAHVLPLVIHSASSGFGVLGGTGGSVDYLCPVDSVKARATNVPR